MENTAVAITIAGREVASKFARKSASRAALPATNVHRSPPSRAWQPPAANRVASVTSPGDRQATVNPTSGPVELPDAVLTTRNAIGTTRSTVGYRSIRRAAMMRPFG